LPVASWPRPRTAASSRTLTSWLAH